MPYSNVAKELRVTVRRVMTPTSATLPPCCCLGYFFCNHLCAQLSSSGSSSCVACHYRRTTRILGTRSNTTAQQYQQQQGGRQTESTAQRSAAQRSTAEVTDLLHAHGDLVQVHALDDEAGHAGAGVLQARGQRLPCIHSFTHVRVHACRERGSREAADRKKENHIR